MAQYTYANPGKTIRMGRILDPRDNRAAVVAYDHGSMVGVIPGNENPGRTLEQLAEGGADAILVAPGTARTYASIFAGRGAPGLIMRLDWWNLWREQDQLGYHEGSGCLLGEVEDAARLGADAVLVYFFIGFEDHEQEAAQVETVAEVARECEKMGIGCMIEPMARGGLAPDPYDAKMIALGSRMAAEFGADALKVEYSGDADSFRQVTDAVFCPVLIAGGPKTNTMREALNKVRGALDAGANGMFIGRNVFQSDKPTLMMSVMRRLIHEDLSVDVALGLLGADTM